MKNKKYIAVLALILVFLVFLVVIFVFANRNTTNTTDSNLTNTNTSNSSQNQNSEELETTNIEVPVGTPGENLGVEMNSAGIYTNFESSQTIPLSGYKNVYFFAASWCPTCRVLDRDINNNLENIPSDVAIINVDFDKERELKQRYGVTFQHTLIQVDENGNELKKWAGSFNLEDLLGQMI